MILLNPQLRPMPKIIELKCPECGNTLRIPHHKGATFIGRRTCLCKCRWMVQAEIIRVKDGIIARQICWTRQYYGGVDDKRLTADR